MKAFFRVLAAFTLLAIYSAASLAQTPEEIIEKHLAALGGRAALGKLTTRVLSGSIVVTSPIGELYGTVEMYSKSPNKSRTLIKVEVPGAGQFTDDQRFDGTVGYVINTFAGNREITGSQLDGLRSSAFPTPLLNYKESGAVLTPAGQEKVGSADAYVIRVTSKAGPTARLFFDKQSFMLVKMVNTINSPQLGGDVEQVMEYSDFREVDGVKVPFSTKTINPAQTVVGTVKEVKHNVEIDDSSFSKPSGQ
jgi:zinc protease